MRCGHIKCMPIAADRFTITVSLIHVLLRYTVVRTAVCSRVPRYGIFRWYPTLHISATALIVVYFPAFSLVIYKKPKNKLSKTVECEHLY